MYLSSLGDACEAFESDFIDASEVDTERSFHLRVVLSWKCIYLHLSWNGLIFENISSWMTEEKKTKKERDFRIL